MVWFVARVRGRILAAGDTPLSGVLQLNEPTAGQRSAAVRLVGRPRRAGSSLRMDLAVVEEILRRGPWPAGLADAVETLSGPVVDGRAERAREAAAWEAVCEGLAPATARFPGLDDWWNAWCATGALKRAARAEAARISAATSPAVAADLVSRLAAVLEMLPSAGQPLAVLAREAVGDAHGLDSSRPLGRLAAAVVRAAFVPGAADGELSTRDSWAAAGVVLSNVASTALCLGVPGVSAGAAVADHSPQTATAGSLEAMRAARMPMVLTLDQVRSGGVRAIPRGGVIHVCENPTVVEVVAQRWARTTGVLGPRASGVSGGSGAPGTSGTSGASGTFGTASSSVTTGAGGPVLVCTSGQPSTAVIDLLSALAGEGAEVRYHGDFDWAGLRIAQSLSSHVLWVPWRYTAADYRAAVRQGMPSRNLTGTSAESPWDPELTVAMAEGGLVIEEEAVANLLAADVLAGWVPSIKPA
ncbi:DUF2399 domain-containing protein [Georgenia subflava]|nr:DUF2399 domain-containing protein [Georgenia subflava]